jgi:hypothetical protein
MLRGDPEYFLDWTLRNMVMNEDAVTPEARAEYRRAMARSYVLGQRDILVGSLRAVAARLRALPAQRFALPAGACLLVVGGDARLPSPGEEGGDAGEAVCCEDCGEEDGDDAEAGAGGGEGEGGEAGGADSGVAEESPKRARRA